MNYQFIDQALAECDEMGMPFLLADNLEEYSYRVAATNYASRSLSKTDEGWSFGAIEYCEDCDLEWATLMGVNAALNFGHAWGSAVERDCEAESFIEDWGTKAYLFHKREFSYGFGSSWWGGVQQKLAASRLVRLDLEFTGGNGHCMTVAIAPQSFSQAMRERVIGYYELWQEFLWQEFFASNGNKRLLLIEFDPHAKTRTILQSAFIS